MPLRKYFAVIVCLAMLPAVSAAAGAAIVKPIPADPESMDLSNGTFDVQVANMDSFDSDRSLTLELYTDDRYDPEEIRALAPGDTLWINGKEYTVEEVSSRDSSWLGEEPETVYDISTKEDCWDGIWFADNGSQVFAHIGDWNPVTYVGTVTVPLPLPASFIYYDYPGGEEAHEGGEKEFLEDLRDHTPKFFSPYNTFGSFRNGELTEVHNWSYPWGPDEEPAPDEEDDA